MRIGRLLSWLGEQERHFERAPPHRRQRGRHLVEDRGKQIGEPGEGERGFGLGPSVKEDAREALRCLFQAGLPEDRLADPRLAGEDKRAEPSGTRSRNAWIEPSSSSRPMISSAISLVPLWTRYGRLRSRAGSQPPGATRQARKLQRADERRPRFPPDPTPRPSAGSFALPRRARIRTAIEAVPGGASCRTSPRARSDSTLSRMKETGVATDVVLVRELDLDRGSSSAGAMRPWRSHRRDRRASEPSSSKATRPLQAST